MKVTLGLIRRGALAGLGLTAVLCIIDALWYRGYLFGLLGGVLGVTAGGVALGLALAMALTSYYLASRSRAPSLRKRLLAGAIWTGAAGMTCGVTSVGVWLIAGRPWFP